MLKISKRLGISDQLNERVLVVWMKLVADNRGQNIVGQERDVW